MNISVSKDGWFFISENLNDLLEIVKDCEFLFNIESIEAFLSKKEPFVLLKTIVPPLEQEVIEDFYSVKHNVIANIEKNSSIDVNIKNVETHFGGGIYKDNNSWNLFIPLTL